MLFNRKKHLLGVLLDLIVICIHVFVHNKLMSTNRPTFTNAKKLAINVKRYISMYVQYKVTSTRYTV